MPFSCPGILSRAPRKNKTIRDTRAEDEKRPLRRHPDGDFTRGSARAPCRVGREHSALQVKWGEGGREVRGTMVWPGGTWNSVSGVQGTGTGPARWKGACLWSPLKGSFPKGPWGRSEVWSPRRRDTFFCGQGPPCPGVPIPEAIWTRL